MEFLFILKVGYVIKRLCLSTTLSSLSSSLANLDKAQEIAASSLPPSLILLATLGLVRSNFALHIHQTSPIANQIKAQYIDTRPSKAKIKKPPIYHPTQLVLP